MDKIKNLASFGALDTDIEVGDSVQKTTQLCSMLGIVALCNKDADVLERDVQVTRSMEKQNNFFIYTTKNCKEDNDNEEENELPPCSSTVSNFVREIQNDIPCRRRVSI